MYYLPHNLPIDIEGSIDGMLEGRKTYRYFFDIKTGDVGCLSSTSHKKLDPERYFKLPKVSEKEKVKWFREFIKMCVYSEDKIFAKRLKIKLEQKGFNPAIKLLSKNVNEWMAGWNSWQGDSAFELLGSWLMNLPVKVSYKWKGCEDCPLCKEIMQ